MTTPIKYACPHCGRRIATKPELAGQSVTCSACGGVFIEPTDPLPGKTAEKKPPPLPEGIDPTRDYSLALLSNPDGSGMQTMQGLYEARVIPENPAPSTSFAWPPGKGEPPRPPQTATSNPKPPSTKQSPPALIPALPPVSHAKAPTLPLKSPIPAAGLAGISPQQMIDELGRRGLVGVLLLYDFSEEDSAQMLHTQHLNPAQAFAMVTEFRQRAIQE